jgi:hypothetical protein
LYFGFEPEIIHRVCEELTEVLLSEACIRTSEVGRYGSEVEIKGQAEILTELKVGVS